MARGGRAALHHLGEASGCSCSPAGWIASAFLGATSVALGVMYYQSRKELELERERAKKKGKGGDPLTKMAKTAAKVLPFLI